MRAGYNLYCFDIMTILFKINLPASELSKRLKTEIKGKRKEKLNQCFLAKVRFLGHYQNDMHTNETEKYI